MSQTSLNFYLSNRFLLAEMGLTGFFSSLRFYFFCKPGLIGFFSSWRCYFSSSQPDPLIVGASDIGHRYYGPETGHRVWESNPGPTNRSCCKVRELNPGPTKKIACKATGSNPGPTKKIVHTILHEIAKYDCAHDRKISHA